MQNILIKGLEVESISNEIVSFTLGSKRIWQLWDLGIFGRSKVIFWDQNESEPECSAIGHDHHGLRVPVGEVDVVDKLDAPGVADHVPADRYSQLKGPLLFNGEEEPNDYPEEQVEDGAYDAGQDSAIEAALVDEGVVVEERSIAYCDVKNGDE